MNILFLEHCRTKKNYVEVNRMNWKIQYFPKIKETLYYKIEFIVTLFQDPSFSSEQTMRSIFVMESNEKRKRTK